MPVSTLVVVDVSTYFSMGGRTWTGASTWWGRTTLGHRRWVYDRWQDGELQNVLEV